MPSSTLRISELEVYGFRGIPSLLFVDFRPPGSDAASMIISGDNGTGKSSIVDALEFALQGRLLRARLIRSLTASGGGCWAAVKFSDGTKVLRVEATSRDGPHPSYAASPFVIRRVDIEEFWSMPPRLRLRVFRQYLRIHGAPDAPVTPFPSPGKVTEQTTVTGDLKAHRGMLRSALASRLGINIDQVPVDEKGLNEFAAKRLYHVSPAEYKKMRLTGKFPRLDSRTRDLFLALRDANREIVNEKREGKIRKAGAHVTAEDMTRTSAALVRASAGVTEAFKRISPAGVYVDQLVVTIGKPIPVALSIDVKLTSGSTTAPEMLLSEASLDLLAFLYYVMIAKESALLGQAKLLVIDDVLQSIDATIRVLATEYVLEEFKDWQLVFTVHDRLWAEQLRQMMQSRGHRFVEYDVLRWHPTTGPVLSTGSGELDVPLRQALSGGSPQGVCLHAAVLLERLCSELSYALPISIARRRGDRYTLGDLWPGVYKVLSKTTCAAVATDVERWLHLRNLAGAHYNEWALSLSAHEARQFGEAVLGLLSRVRCGACQRWVQRLDVAGSAAVWSCRCGVVRIERAQLQG